MQHALFVVDDDFWCTKIEQATQTVVAVDYATVQVVQVGSGKATTIKLHHWAQVWRNNRNNVEDHCLRVIYQTTSIITTVERSNDLQALDCLLLTLRAEHLAVVAIHDGVTECNFFSIEVDGVDERLNRLCTSATNEVFAVTILHFTPQLFVFHDHA